MDETLLSVSESGEILTEKDEKSKKRILTSSFETILTLVQNEDMPVDVVTRAIAVEIARVSGEIAEIRNDQTLIFKLKPLSEQVKTLRELARTLIEGEERSQKDVLNFDGPKFQYVLFTVVDLFRQTLEEVGVDETTRATIMRMYRDKMSTTEADIRRNVAKIQLPMVNQ